MTEKKLIRANQLAKQIEETKDYILMARSTQYEDRVVRPLYIDLNWYDDKLQIPESLFRIVGKLILNEHQQILNELETEFNNL